MRWKQDLSKSNKCFVEVVWPIVRDWCGGGEIIPVEGNYESDVRAALDINAGIDGWQIFSDEGRMRGIASRVQWIEEDWQIKWHEDGRFDTFTIRTSRPSGNKTELEKRLEAINDENGGWVYPHLTIQSYHRSNNSLLSCAMVMTKDLYEYVQWHGVEGFRVRLNRDGSSSFIAVPWKDLCEYGVAVTTHTAIRMACAP